jgi:hypothetical protein
MALYNRAAERLAKGAGLYSTGITAISKSRKIEVKCGGVSQLNLTLRQAYWLTRASQLKGFSSPTVYRIGSWRTLARIEAINVALAEAEAEIIGL